MKKILKNVFKWLILVLICYSLMFTGIIIIQQDGIIGPIVYSLSTTDGDYLKNLESSELEEFSKYYQELADNVISNVNNELYQKYPAGFSRLLSDVSLYRGMGSLHIISLVIGIVIGTAIYTMLDKEKKGLKVIISVYIVFIIILGFVEGIQIEHVSGNNLTLLDKWSFPQTFIFPITAVFISAIVVRILRQKDIAKKLNIKLEEKKSKRIDEKKED